MKHYQRRVAFYFRYAWLFSLFINLAMLTLPLYMLQVYDRMLTSRSFSTLLLLTLGAAFVYVVYAGLGWLRSRILVQASMALDGLLARRAFADAVSRAAQPSRREHLTAGGLLNCVSAAAHRCGSAAKATLRGKGYYRHRTSANSYLNRSVRRQ